MPVSGFFIARNDENKEDVPYSDVEAIFMAVCPELCNGIQYCYKILVVDNSLGLVGANESSSTG